VTREMISQWRAALYSPDRMVVSISGGVDEDEFLNLAEQWFGTAKATAAPTVDAAEFIGGEARMARKIEQANLVFQMVGPDARSPDMPVARLFTEILGGGMASRLFQSAREERGLAYAIDAYMEPYDDIGLIGIYAGAAAERSQELAQVCAEQVVELATGGPTEAELQRAKAVMAAGLWMADESAANRSARHATQALVYGAPVASQTLVDSLEAVTADDMRRFGQALLADGRTASAVLGPKSAIKAAKAFASTISAHAS